MPISRTLINEALCTVIKHARRWQTVEAAAMALLNANHIADNLDKEAHEREQYACTTAQEQGDAG